MSEANHWGLTKRQWRIGKRLRNKTFEPPFGVDTPADCLLGEDYWHAYPIRNYNYVYNSWGFRDHDFEQHVGKEVNICIGDSDTVNIAGPVDHSWPRQLGQYFDIPTLNFGIDGLSFSDIDSMLTKIRSNFRVKRVFILYNLFDNDQKIASKIIPSYNNLEIENKIKGFKQYCFRDDVYWQFDPPWSFDKEELRCLYEYFPAAHDYLKKIKPIWSSIDYQLAVSCKLLNTEYCKIAGDSWPTYPEFLQRLIIAPDKILEEFPSDFDRRLILGFLSDHLLKLVYTNRDGYHLSKYVNKALADYFYQLSVTNIKNF